MDFFSPKKSDRTNPTPPRESYTNSPVSPNIVNAPKPRGEIWFTKNTDYCYYSNAQKACRDCKKKILQLRLSPEERDMLIAPPLTTELVMDHMQKILEDRERPKQRYSNRQGKSRELGAKFLDVVELVCGITSLLVPIHKEFQFVVGMFMVIFRAVINKRDREDGLIAQMEEFAPKLLSCKDYFRLTPNGACKKAAGRLYVDILDYAEVLLIHFRHTKSGKLIEAIVHSAPDAFDDCLDNIEGSVLKLREAVATVPILDKEGGNARSMVNMMQAFERATQTLTASLETLDSRVTSLESQQTSMNKFTMTQYAQTLKNAVMANPLDVFWAPEDSLTRVTAHGFRLTHTDHWENNGILETLADWRDNPRSPVLWLGGQSGTQDPWVSQLSVDTIAALEISDMPCMYTLCSDLAAFGLPITATRVLRNLICQILDKEPKIAFENPGFFTVERMQRAMSFLMLWPIFEKLVEGLADDLFIIIDRVELVQPDEISTMNADFIPGLIHLIARLPNTRAILTSMFEPPPEIMSFHQSGLLDMTYIDTARPRLMMS